MKHDNPQNLVEELANLREAWAELISAVKTAFKHDVWRIRSFFNPNVLCIYCDNAFYLKCNSCGLERYCKHCNFCDNCENNANKYNGAANENY